MPLDKYIPNFFFQFPKYMEHQMPNFRRCLYITCSVYERLSPVSLRKQWSVQILAISWLCKCYVVLVLVLAALLPSTHWCGLPYTPCHIKISDLGCVQNALRNIYVPLCTCFLISSVFNCLNLLLSCQGEVLLL